MVKNVKKISHRAGRTEKPGRLGNATLFGSPSDQRFRGSLSILERQENLKTFAAEMVDLGLDQAFPHTGRRGLPTSFSMEPEDVAKIVRTIGIPLAGHTTEALWRPNIPDGESWTVSSGGGLAKFAFGWEYPTRLMPPRHDAIHTESRFEFGADGSLIRTRVHIHDTNETNNEAVALRKVDDSRAITTEEVLGSVSVVLSAFEPLRLALTGDANIQVLNQLAKIRAQARELSRMLRHTHGRILMLRGWEAAAILNEVLADDTHAVEAFLRGKKKPRARETMMEQLVPCFRILFRRRPTTDSTLTNSPFIRFATKMFETLGCPCSPRTVGTTLRTWQRARKCQRE
jgi:hypothetical protein